MNRRHFVATTLLSLLAPAAWTAVSKPQQEQIIRLISREARRYRVSIPLALAVAEVESSFNPNALSPKGAIGVMQILPATAWGEYGIEAEQLYDPLTNIRIGLHFLARLLKQYHQQTRYALSHYNGGSRVGPWPRSQVIPATRPYVKRVLQRQRHYRLLLAQGQLPAR